MKNALKIASLIGVATFALAPTATTAMAAPAAVYTALDGTTVGVAPVYYRCGRKGCGYYFSRRYSYVAPVSYTYPYYPYLPFLGLGLL